DISISYKLCKLLRKHCNTLWNQRDPQILAPGNHLLPAKTRCRQDFFGERESLAAVSSDELRSDPQIGGNTGPDSAEIRGGTQFLISQGLKFHNSRSVQNVAETEVQMPVHTFQSAFDDALFGRRQ